MRQRGGGFSLPETVAVVAILGLMLALAIPRARAARGLMAARAAGRALSVALQGVRWSAVGASASHGLMFVADDRGWSWTAVRDGNGNGLSTGEVLSGIDPALDRPVRLEDIVPGAWLGFPDTTAYPRVPPSKGWVVPSDDPVRLGNTNLLAYSPIGTSSSGTIYITDGARLYALVLYGRTGRARLWRYDKESGRWAR